MKEESLTSFAVCGAFHQAFWSLPGNSSSYLKIGISNSHRCCLNLVSRLGIFLHFQSGLWGNKTSCNQCKEFVDFQTSNLTMVGTNGTHRYPHLVTCDILNSI